MPTERPIDPSAGVPVELSSDAPVDPVGDVSGEPEGDGAGEAAGGIAVDLSSDAPADPVGEAPVELPLTVGRGELLRDGGDEEFRRLVHNLLAFSGRLQEIRDRLGALVGLSGPAYTILISVAHLSGRAEVGVTPVARHLNLSQPYVTAEVNKLVAAGLVDKVASQRDGRSVSLTVTPRAVELLRRLAPHQQAVNDQLFVQLSEPGFDQLSGMAARFVADADRALALARRATGEAASVVGEQP